MSGHQVSLYAGTSRVPARGHYRSGAVLTGAAALRWVPYATAVSTVRALMGASHEDLRLRAQQLSRALGSTFFYDTNAEQRTVPPFSATTRFPEEELFICSDHSPFMPALQAVNQAMAQVALKDASQEACACYYDAVGKLLRLLTNNVYEFHVFTRAKFESRFGLQWVTTISGVASSRVN